MNKQEFLSLLSENTDDSQVIRGIFNWCDRWCEKCTKTDFCTVYKTSVRLPSDTPEDFFNSISLLFEATMEMLGDYFKDLDIELESLDESLENTDFEDEDIEEKYSFPDDGALNLAKQYGKQVKHWLAVLKKKNTFSMEVRLQDEMLADCMEVIHWYQHLFEVKMSSALMAQKYEKEESLNPYDSLGNAKLLLVSIERNIAAWGYLYQKFKDDEDEILDILVSLQRLSKIIEQLFPEARAFIREGLDG